MFPVFPENRILFCRGIDASFKFMGASGISIADVRMAGYRQAVKRIGARS
jgi:hypothetical protein